MKCWRLSLLFAGLLCACATWADPGADPDAEDVVVLAGRVMEPDGTGISGVPVTDGFSMVQTDAEGRYELGIDPGRSRFVAISLPSGYEIPRMASGHPLFFHPISRKGKGETDFVLTPERELVERYVLLAFGDIQLRDRPGNMSVPNLRRKIVPDVVDFVTSLKVPAYAISLGDLVWNHMDLYPEYCEQMGRLGIPVFNVIGNHDHDPSVRGDELSDCVYESYFGPANYSFNIGRIHYVMLDDVIYTQKQDFRKGLTDDILAWLRKDLSYVKKGTTLVVGMHIPLDTNEQPDTGDRFENYKGMMELLKDYKVHFLAGHRHAADTYNFPAPYEGLFVHHLCARTGGEPKINGDYCRDGTPSGYLVVEVDGDDLKWYHKTIGNDDRDFQMTVFTPAQTGNDYLFANVWYWDTKWGSVEWWENGKKAGEMERHSRVDLNFDREYRKANKGVGTKEKTWHMFRIKPTPGVRSGIVKVTDRFGRTYEQQVEW